MSERLLDRMNAYFWHPNASGTLPTIQFDLEDDEDDNTLELDFRPIKPDSKTGYWPWEIHCECGSHKIYGKDIPKEMHSDWCRLRKYR